jgi:xanthine dehydrogenase accessory factor
VNKELELWDFIAAHLQKSERVMLLVVATSSGSSPGRPGYKMAVAENGALAGSIGGGVMEVNLVEQSRSLLGAQVSLPASPQSSETYPILSEQVHRKNAPNASGMICSGKQTVIFKLLTPDMLPIISSVVEGVRRRDGSTIVIDPEFLKTEPATAETQNDIDFTRHSDTGFEYRERLGAKQDLYIVGGGHCALALSELMSKMDFHVELFDDRPQLNTLEKNHSADKINVIQSYDRIGDHIPSSDCAYVVVMTLGYKTDAIVVRQLINKDFKYFGVLGSRAKIATLRREFIDEGIPKERLGRLHAPIGVPINSHSPEEIAVSIAAEIIDVKNSASPLRSKPVEKRRKGK